MAGLDNGKSLFLMGKVTINGNFQLQFSIAMLVYQRVTNDEQGFRSFFLWKFKQRAGRREWLGLILVN